MTLVDTASLAVDWEEFRWIFCPECLIDQMMLVEGLGHEIWTYCPQCYSYLDLSEEPGYWNDG